jgi:tetratricopeptide (TPR) repeat protein
VQNADQLLTTAQETGARDGLRNAVPAYLAAIDALLAEKRVANAITVMIDLLKAQEKKKGLFARTEKNPLGPERLTVGLKFAELTKTAPPTEDALDQLGYLALDFPDEIIVRRANADALRQAGYAADAIDEYRYCAAHTEDAEVNQRIADLYGAVGRPDDAAVYLLRALSLYANEGEFSELAAHAESFLEMRPAAIGDLIELLSPAPGGALLGRAFLLDELSHRVEHAGVLDAAQIEKAREQLKALYERLVQVDRTDETAARGLAQLQAVGSITEPPPTPVPATPPPSVVEEPVIVAPAPAAAEVPAAPQAPQVSPLPQASQVPPVEAIPAPPQPPPPAQARTTPASNALAAFTRRKAKELSASGDYQGAVLCYERLLRSGSDIESLEGALDCYLALNRVQDALRIGVELVNEKADAGDLEGALAVIDRMSAAAPESNFGERRSELLVALGRPESVGR